MKELDLLEIVLQCQNIEELENKFQMYNSEIVDLEKETGRSRYYIIKIKLLSIINTAIQEGNMEKLNLLLSKNKENCVSYIFEDNNYIQMKICKKIISINDPKKMEYVKFLIENLKLTASAKADLICNSNLLNIDEKVKMLIKNPDIIKSGMEVICSTINDIARCTNLVLATCDIEFIKDIIESNEKYKIDKTYIIKALGDKNYIKQCIENSQISGINRTFLLEHLNDTDYVKQCIENKDIKSINRLKLLKKINDKKYITECIKRGHIKTISDYEKINLICNIYKDSSFGEIKDVLFNENLGLNRIGRLSVILKMDNPENIEEYLKTEKEELKDYEKNVLQFATGNANYFETNPENKQRLSIPPNLKFGIEIESRE